MGTYIIHFDDKPWEDLDDELYYRCFEIPWFSTTKTTISRLTPYTEDSAYAHGYTEAESKYRKIRDELEKQAYQRGYETAKHECEANIQSNRDEAYNKGHNDGFKFGYEKLKDLEHERVEKAYQRGYKEAYDTAYADAEGIYESGKRAMYQKGLKDAWEAARKICDMKWTKRNEVFGIDVYADIIALPVSECIEKIRQYEQEKEEQITKGDVIRIKSTPEIEILVTYADEEYVSGIALTEVDGNCEIGDQYTNIRISNVEKTGKHYDIVSVLQKMREESNG